MRCERTGCGGEVVDGATVCNRCGQPGHAEDPAPNQGPVAGVRPELSAGDALAGSMVLGFGCLMVLKLLFIVGAFVFILTSSTLGIGPKFAAGACVAIILAVMVSRGGGRT
jgi:hypothetical protein